MSNRVVLKSMIALLSGGLALGGCASTKSAEESPEAQGTYADAPKAPLTGKTEGVPPLLQRMRPVTEAMINDPAPGSWLSWRRNPQAWGYSPLKQIDRDTVKGLRLVWSWGMNDKRTESQPLVHDGVMFLNQSASIVQALDAANGNLLWSYERKLPP
jgi:hypothetical protein